jgi:hypothetical protein
MTPSMVTVLKCDSSLQEYMSDLFQILGTALLNALVFPLHETTQDQDGNDLVPFTEQVARHGLYCIHSCLGLGMIMHST